MDQNEKYEWSQEELAVRRKRSIVLGLIIGGLAILFFVTTIVRLTNNLAAGS